MRIGRARRTTMRVKGRRPAATAPRPCRRDAIACFNERVCLTSRPERFREADQPCAVAHGLLQIQELPALTEAAGQE